MKSCKSVYSIFFFVCALLLIGLDHVLYFELADWTVHFVLHAELALALGGTSELGGVAKHSGKRHICVEDKESCLCLCVCDGTTTAHELSHDA